MCSNGVYGQSKGSGSWKAVVGWTILVQELVDGSLMRDDSG